MEDKITPKDFFNSLWNGEQNPPFPSSEKSAEADAGSELLPCPFCGEQPEVLEVNDTIPTRLRCWSVGCPMDLQMITPERWNTRAPLATQDGGWRDISTAPRNGTMILLWWPYWRNHAVIGYWRLDEWQSHVRLSLDVPNPTHWMPLPEPPSGALAGEK